LKTRRRAKCMARYFLDHPPVSFSTRRNTLVASSNSAAVHRLSFEHAFPDLVGLHTPEEHLWFFRERLFASCELWGYFENEKPVGIIAFREGWIDQLYVLPPSHCRGFGTALLQIAQSRYRRLSLWTFQRNRNARRFYERRGFKLVNSKTYTLELTHREQSVMWPGRCPAIL